jgi:hypothetical protein
MAIRNKQACGLLDEGSYGSLGQEDREIVAVDEVSIDAIERMEGESC